MKIFNGAIALYYLLIDYMNEQYEKHYWDATTRNKFSFWHLYELDKENEHK